MAGSKSAVAGPPRPSWLAERHPDWKGLRSVAAVTARRIDKKTGRESLETRYSITSLEPDPKAILAAMRAHWGDREQSPLDDGRDLRRRPLQNQKRRLAAEFRRHPTHRLQHPQAPTRQRAPCAENASEPASTLPSEQSSSPLNDLGFRPGN